MKYGFEIKNQNNSLLYDNDTDKPLVYLGKRRSYGNEWFKPAGSKHFGKEFVVFCNIVKGSPIHGKSRCFRARGVGPAGLEKDSYYIGYSENTGHPESASPAPVDKSIYADFYVFGSIDKVPLPDHGLVIGTNVNNKWTDIRFHSGSAPLQFTDVPSVLQDTTMEFSYPCAIPVGIWDYGHRDRRHKTLQAYQNSLRTMWVDSPTYGRIFYTDTFTVPVINGNYYSKYPNIINI